MEIALPDPWGEQCVEWKPENDMAGKPLVSSSPKKEGAMSDAARRFAACMLETLRKVVMFARVCEKDSGAVSDAGRRCSVCSLKKRLDYSTRECVFGGFYVEVCF